MRVSKEQKREKTIKPKISPESKLGLTSQKDTTNNNEDEIQIKEEDLNDETVEKQLQPENTNSSDDDSTKIRKNEEETNMPIRGSIKWEKSRTSARVTKKPDRWGNNIMVSKIDKIEQESLPEEASPPA